MGAWGFKALDSDQALDWLGDYVIAEIEPNIDSLLAKAEKLVEDQGGEVDRMADHYGHELRAAGHVLVSLNFFHDETLHNRCADLLQKLLESDWMDSWNEPDEVRTELQGEIRNLKTGQQPTTLMENLD